MYLWTITIWATTQNWKKKKKKTVYPTHSLIYFAREGDIHGYNVLSKYNKKFLQSALCVG